MSEETDALHARVLELEGIVDKFTIATGGGITAKGSLREGFAIDIPKTVSDGSSSGGAGGGGGGADNLETVTGAVNGVPSTLQVQTDGNGWTAI